MKTYTVTWKEASTHAVTITEEEMARIKSVPVEELRDMDVEDVWDGLEDELAELEDDGFEGVERNDINVEES